MRKLLFLLFTLLLSGTQFVRAAALDEWIENNFKPVSDVVQKVIFFSISINGQKLPLVLVWLIAGALFFTLYYGFINIRGFGRAINVVQGKYDDIEGGDEPVTTDTIHHTEEGDIPDTIRVEGHAGEISHFQALTAALSATVGLGNIAGVAIAISLGGPGATFWMIIAGLLGMSSKFTECTLGVKYRTIDKNGKVFGGPMYYLRDGLANRGMSGIGKFFAGFFALMCIGGSLGGGNMFQVNQAFKQFSGTFGLLENNGAIFGIIMAVLVALVIIGGIKSIAKVTEKIVPFMVLIYCIAAIVVLIANFSGIPAAFGKIFAGAFAPTAVTGGLVGVLIQGIQRAAFSNEAGIGSASIAHSAVKTRYPASEGLVALLEPFIDTVIVCTMTALVIIVTGNYNNSGGLGGVELTSNAFATVISWFPVILAMAVILFAFSTMISWSYYGEQASYFLFGKSKTVEYVYKLLFCLFIIVGAAASLKSVIGFSDAMIFAMCFPNIIGLYILRNEVKDELNKYESAIRESGK